jgi:hypothetical protein
VRPGAISGPHFGRTLFRTEPAQWQLRRHAFLDARGWCLLSRGSGVRIPRESRPFSESLNHAREGMFQRVGVSRSYVSRARA